MINEYDVDVQKYFTKIKRWAFLLFGFLIVFLLVCIVSNVPSQNGPSDIKLALILMFGIVLITGMLCSYLHKISWVRRFLGGKESEIDGIKIEKLYGWYKRFFLGSFISWLYMCIIGFIASIFLGNKLWLPTLGLFGIIMMIITWPKKDDIVNFIFLGKI